MSHGTSLQWNIPGPGNQLVKVLLRFSGQRRKRHVVHADVFFEAGLTPALLTADFLAEDLVAKALTDVDLTLLDWAAAVLVVCLDLACLATAGVALMPLFAAAAARLAGRGSRLTETAEKLSGVTLSLA